MKKAITSLILGAMILGGNVTALAESCSLDPEAYQEVIEIKDEFIDDLIKDGEIDDKKALYISEHFIDESGQNELRTLGFSSWLKNHGYTDPLL